LSTSTALALASKEFADFGQYLSHSNTPAAADNPEYSYWGRVAGMTFGEKASSGILLCHKRELVVKSFERHERTPEVLVALDGGDSLLCLAKPASRPTDVRWFEVHQGDAFALHSGTWHWIPFPTEARESRFLVIFAWGTEEGDLHYSDLPLPLRFALDH
jgi:ureidoglycolate hydrolase